MAKHKGFAKICKNPRFSLDPLRLYANLLRVTTWLIRPGGDGTKTGFPLHCGGYGVLPVLQRLGEGGRIQRKAAKPRRGPPQPNSDLPQKITKFAKKYNFVDFVCFCFNSVPRAARMEDSHSVKSGKSVVHRLWLRLAALGSFAAKLPIGHESGRQEAQTSGVDHREIREIRESGFAFVRVFRVVRGGNASFLSLLSLFAANQWKCLSRNHLQITPSFGGQTGSNPVKPSQTIFSL